MEQSSIFVGVDFTEEKLDDGENLQSQLSKSNSSLSLSVKSTAESMRRFSR